MKLCPFCGQPVAESIMICPTCGNEVGEGLASAPTEIKRNDDTNWSHIPAR